MESKDVIEGIDLEEGKIRINGKWLTEDEIRYAIKMKVSSDDYNVADLAVALRTLIDEMNKSQVLRVRVPKELVEELESISKEKEESVEALLRRIIIDYIHSPAEIEEESEEESDEDVEEDEEEEDEDYNDIEIGFRSRVVEPEITIEAQPVEAVEAEEEVPVEEVEEEIPEEEVEEEIEEVEDIQEEEAPEDDLEEGIVSPEDDDILGIEADEDIDIDEDDLGSEEIEEEIQLGGPEEEVVPETDEAEEVTAEEPEKDEEKKKKKRMILRRKKILRRRP